MAVHRVRAEGSARDRFDVWSADWLTLLVMAVLLSPFFYDLWTAVFGS